MAVQGKRVAPADQEDFTLARRAIIFAVLALLATGGVALGGGSNSELIRVANSCAADCRAKHNQCRIETKGSPKCDAKLQKCLSRCLGR